ncbi:hypothetical protein SRHO_G00119940 [Serrasalmus rhombeus]
MWGMLSSSEWTEFISREKDLVISFVYGKKKSISEGCSDLKFPAFLHCTTTARLHIHVVQPIFGAEAAAYRLPFEFANNKVKIVRLRKSSLVDLERATSGCDPSWQLVQHWHLGVTRRETAENPKVMQKLNHLKTQTLKTFCSLSAHLRAKPQHTASTWF